MTTNTKDKARNESLNRLILQHAEDMVYANKRCAGLVLALVVSMVGTAYSMYYLSKGCDQPMQKVVSSMSLYPNPLTSTEIDGRAA